MFLNEWSMYRTELSLPKKKRKEEEEKKGMERKSGESRD